ncbi:MAG: FKBP-type peptidyl-prolyl cis-trans isomerase [Lentisphaeria bacterium]|nr:FKBP-type peptidyl-prolyl cis-trans isomerase [Lentisphaeria bacterium]
MNPADSASSCESCLPALYFGSISKQHRERINTLMVKSRRKNTNSKGSPGLNRKETEAFLAKNAKKPGVIETKSGLQYMIIDEGDGPSPAMDDVVVVDQRVSLLNGTVVADTYRTGEKDRFSLREAIAGLREGMLLMPLGARYKFFVGPDLAWGKRGAGVNIGPFATLIFDIRLLEIRENEGDMPVPVQTSSALKRYIKE